MLVCFYEKHQGYVGKAEATGDHVKYGISVFSQRELNTFQVPIKHVSIFLNPIHISEIKKSYPSSSIRLRKLSGICCFNQENDDENLIDVLEKINVENIKNCKRNEDVKHKKHVKKTDESDTESEESEETSSGGSEKNIKIKKKKTEEPSSEKKEKKNEESKPEKNVKRKKKSEKDGYIPVLMIPCRELSKDISITSIKKHLCCSSCEIYNNNVCDVQSFVETSIYDALQPPEDAISAYSLASTYKSEEKKTQIFKIKKHSIYHNCLLFVLYK